MPDNKHNIVFVGIFVKDEEILSDIRYSQAGFIFQKKFIAYTKPILTIALVPIFYHNMNKKNTEYINKIYYIGRRITSFELLNKLTRVIYDTILSIALIYKKKHSPIFIYNIDKHTFLISIIARFILRRKIFLIIADYSFYEKKISHKFINFLISKFDGVIALSRNIKCHNNVKYLFGLLDKSKIQINNNKINNNILLSGSLGKTTGLELALDFFSKNEDYNLYITGRPFRYTDQEFTELLKKYIRNKNIFYLGLLNQNEYEHILEMCDIALSLRNPRDQEHEFNFPSKILEFLSYSKLVISTMRYESISSEILYYTEFSEDGIKNILNKIRSTSNSEIQRRRKIIHSFLNKHFTEDNLRRTINELINHYQ